MSSNRTSSEDLNKSPRQNQSSQKTISNNDIEHLSYLVNSNNKTLKESLITDSNSEDLRSKLFKLRASLKQKEEQIYTLKNLNQNLQTELRTQKQLEEQTKTELIQHKQKRKDCENMLKDLKLENGQHKINIRKLMNDKENISSLLDEAKENLELLQQDFDGMKQENERLKHTNSQLEKDKHTLHGNVDKLSRMYTKISADSKRYKSVVDLQRSALNELQKDYNKAVVDLSHNESIDGDKVYSLYPDIQFKRLNDSVEILEKATFSNTMMDNQNYKSSLQGHELSQYNSSRPFTSHTHRFPQSMFTEYIKDPAIRRYQNMSNQFSDSLQTHNESTPNLAERTFNHDLGDKKYISMTEGQIQRKKSVVNNFNKGFGKTFAAGRVSSEQIVDSDTEQSQSDLRITEKHDKFKRSQSRRETRILIQALPKLRTQSKYEDFRQAKSTERRQCFSVRSKLSDIKSFQPSPTVDASQRITKVSISINESTNRKSSLKSPTTGTRTKYSSKAMSSLEKTGQKTSKKGQRSSVQSYQNQKSIKSNVPSQNLNHNESYNQSLKSSVQSKGLKQGGKVSKTYKKSTLAYPKPSSRSRLHALDCIHESQLKTLSQHLSAINQRKMKLENEKRIIDLSLKDSSKVKSSRNY